MSLKKPNIDGKTTFVDTEGDEHTFVVRCDVHESVDPPETWLEDQAYYIDDEPWPVSSLCRQLGEETANKLMDAAELNALEEGQYD